MSIGCLLMDLPVVKAGVHSCSPVAPQSSVFDGVVVADELKGEPITDVFRLPTVKVTKSSQVSSNDPKINSQICSLK